MRAEMGLSSTRGERELTFQSGREERKREGRKDQSQD